MIDPLLLCNQRMGEQKSSLLPILAAYYLTQLTRTPSECLGDIGEKLTVLQVLMQEGRWFDGRDFQVLDSIQRDVKAMVLKWQG